MAESSYGVNATEARKLWSEKLFREILKKTWCTKFIGKSADSMIQLVPDTQKGAGDRVTVPLVMQLAGFGIQGDNTLEGNEEALTTYTDNLLIDQIRHAAKTAGQMTEQRVPWNIRNTIKDQLADWWSGMIDLGLMNQLGGNTGQADTRQTGNNATLAPDTNHIYYANGVANETQVASASASNIFKLKFIDYLREKGDIGGNATGSTPVPIRPIKVGGEDKYILFVHPYQLTSLRTDASTAGNWYDIQKTAMQGGMVSNNPIFTGAEGEYNKTIIHVSARVPSVTTGAYRAIFAGAQAAVMAFGKNYGDAEDPRWVEKTFDYGNKFGVSCGMIWGAKKARFNSVDFGTQVASTYAAAAF